MSERWVRQALTAEFLSDAHLGSGSGGGGIDALVARDRHDRPVIWSSHVEGVLRDAARRLRGNGEAGNFFGRAGGEQQRAVFTSLYAKDNPESRIWRSTQVINWLAHFASSLPLPTACDLAVLNHQRMAVRAGLRVELALLAGDIPRAVHGTVAFFEAALWDRLGERVERSSDPKKRRFFKVKSGNAPTDDKLLRQGDGSDDDRKRPFELKDTVDGIDWYWIYDSDGGPGARIAKYFLQSDALTNFDVALGSSIRELRNDIAHNEPTPALMNDARTRMQTAALWSNKNRFLSQHLVQAVLKELGEASPGDLLKNLLTEVRRRLVVGEAGGAP